MAHTPVNHPMRPLYRALAGLVGLYVLVFGATGLVRTWGADAFARDHTMVLGLRTNLAFSVLSIVAGLVVLAGLVIGRNADAVINKWGGFAFLAAGVTGLALLRTDADYLNFSMSTCVVSFVIGMVLLVAGLYGRVGPARIAASEA